MAYKTNKDYKPPTRDTKQKFIKEMKYIIFCKECGKEIRFFSGWNWRVGTKLCIAHRGIWLRQEYEKYKSNPKRKEVKYKRWKEYIILNIEKRRRWALESYHRNKHKHKDRKHRATKKPT